MGESGIVLRIGATITINPTLTTGAFEQVITISGEAPLIDLKSTSMSENLGREIISKLPVPRFPTELMSYAAGNVGSDQGSTMGGSNYSSNAYKLDGIDVSDPETGTTWVFVNVESIEEMEIMPISGATADVGGFTGAAINMVTKSGGNEFSGGFAYYYFNDDFITWNTDDDGLRENTSRNSLNNDFTGYVGGPIVKDKIWFFGNFGLRKSSSLQGVEDPQETSEKYRNSMWKVSAVLNDSMNLWGTYHYDNYLVDGRFSAYNQATEATADQDGPNHAFAFHYAWVIDDNNLFEAKFNGFKGYFGYQGKGSGSYIYDYVYDWGYGNSPYDYQAWRQRYTGEGVYTTYLTDMAGDHELKVGFNYNYGKGDYLLRYDIILQLAGENYIRYGYYPNEFGSQLTKGFNAYVTDAWSLTDRLLVNAGVRFERPSYEIPSTDRRDDGSSVTGLGDVHTFTNIAPRIGFTYQLDGSGKTVIRGSYGWYYEAVTTAMLQTLSPYASSYIEYYWDGADWIDYYSEEPGDYHLDDDLSGMYTEAFTLGFQHELMPNMAIGVDYVHRQNKDYIVAEETGNVYEPYTFTYDGTSYTVYNLVSSDPYFLITNADNDLLYSKYDAVIFTATKRYSDNWQATASLTLSDYRGTGGEGSSAPTGGEDYFTDPNNQINAKGHFAAHVPWNLKMSGVYSFPYDISLAGYVNYRAGLTWTPTLYYENDNLGQYDVEFYAVERGSERLDPYFQFDMRAEKLFRFDRYQFSLLMDIYNVFNNASETNIQDNIDLSTYAQILGLQSPRVIQLGVRFSF